MKFTLERAALLKSLGHVQSVVERRNTIPILGNVLIRAAGQNVSFAATDMEIEINESVEGQVGKSGAVTPQAPLPVRQPKIDQTAIAKAAKLLGAAKNPMIVSKQKRSSLRRKHTRPDALRRAAVLGYFMRATFWKFTRPD